MSKQRQILRGPNGEKGVIGKAFILWLLGVPVSIIVLLWLFGILH